MAASTEKMNRLIKKKDEIEADIKALHEVLESQRGVGMKEPLVDKDGFPRNDIDVYSVRNARHDINCLQNDHKDTSDNSQTTPELQERLSPFLKVNQVDDGSPASTARLQIGDEILKFGSITSQNFNSLQDIATVVQHSKGKPLTLLVSRGDNELRLSLTPNTWNGRGLLGCNIVPLKKS